LLIFFKKHITPNCIRDMGNIHPKLDRNLVYSISNTIVEDLQTTQSASIVGCPQSVLITQTLEFDAILKQ